MKAKQDVRKRLYKLINKDLIEMISVKIPKKKGKSRVYSNAGWFEINKKHYYFRSSWELKYALYLEFLKKNNEILDWDHEPETFWFESIKRGVRSYLPDFKIINIDESHYWVEVKGYYDSKSLTKIKRFRKYYPKEILVLVDGLWMTKNKKLLEILKVNPDLKIRKVA